MSLGLWSILLRPHGVHTACLETGLKVTNACLVVVPSDPGLPSRTCIKFFRDTKLVAASILVPEESHSVLDLTFPQNANIRIESDGTTDVSVSGMFLPCGARAGERAETTSAAAAVRVKTTPLTSDEAHSIERNSTDNDYPTTNPGVDVISTVMPATEPANGVSFEDLKLGSGHKIHERSIITFSSKMKDGTGAPIDRFSYQLLACPFEQCSWILPGFPDGLNNMRAGGIRKVHMLPAYVANTWGLDGMQDLTEGSLVLELELHKVESS